LGIFLLSIILPWEFFVKHHFALKFFIKHHFALEINTLKTFVSPALGCTLKKEAADFVETLALISHTTRHHIPESLSLDIHRLEELWCQKY
jgi:hypothetical protein